MKLLQKIKLKALLYAIFLLLASCITVQIVQNTDENATQNNQNEINIDKQINTPTTINGEIN